MLSLVGTDCILVNQHQLLPQTYALSVIQGTLCNILSITHFHNYNNYSDFTLVEGNTAGVINWNRVKKKLTCGYEETLCDTRGNSSSSNDKENLKQKHLNADVYSTVVYGLPHITLM